MSEVKKCSKCGGDMQREKLAGFLGRSIDVTETGEDWMKRKIVPIYAFVCGKCGFAELYKEKKEKKE